MNNIDLEILHDVQINKRLEKIESFMKDLRFLIASLEERLEKIENKSSIGCTHGVMF